VREEYASSGVRTGEARKRGWKRLSAETRRTRGDGKKKKRSRQQTYEEESSASRREVLTKKVISTERRTSWNNGGKRTRGTEDAESVTTSADLPRRQRVENGEKKKSYT